MTMYEFLASQSEWIWVFTAGLLTVFLLAVCGALLEIHQRKNPLVLCAEILLFVLNHAVFILAREYKLSGYTDSSFMKLCRDLPMTGVWIFLVTAAVLLSVMVYRNIQYRKKRITPMSVKESFDALSVGICFYYEDGTCKLVNPIMDRMAYRIFGRTISNGIEFWNWIREGNTGPHSRRIQTGDLPLFETEDKKVYSFRRYTHTLEDTPLIEITGSDVTGEYELTQELRTEIERQQDLNRRLKEFSALVEKTTIEKEILETKIRFHDLMGRMIYQTKRALTDGTYREKKEEILEGWKAIQPLLGKNTKPESADVLSELTEAAASIGVKIETEGTLPEGKDEERVFLVAAMECLLNAYRHGNASTLKISVLEDQNQYIIRFCNDGKKPEGTVKEAGGLTYIRNKTESMGGTMNIETDPEFCVVIRFAKRKEIRKS